MGRGVVSSGRTMKDEGKGNTEAFLCVNSACFSLVLKQRYLSFPKEMCD